MKQETREFIIPVRVTFSEKKKICKNAEKVKLQVSTYMREIAMGYEMREKPDKEIIYELIKEMRDVETGIRNIGRTYYKKGFINEPFLDKERQILKELITRTKKELF